MEASVTEIHHHPLRPPGFAEPLFLGPEDRKEIAEHLALSGWLGKASVAAEKEYGTRPCHVYRDADGEAWIVRPGCRGRRRRTKKCRVARVVESWREMRDWWEPEGGTDRLLFRVLLAGGVVADVALDRRYGWSLLRILD